MNYFSRVLDDGNNEAVEQLLTGSPGGAITILLNVLETWRLHKQEAEDAPMLDVVEHPTDGAGPGFSTNHELFYTVDLDAALPEPKPDPAFPFQWYGKPIAICTPEEIEETVTEESLCPHDELKLAVVLYNLGIACQLVSVESLGQTSTGNGPASVAALKMFSLALHVLATCSQDDFPPGSGASLGSQNIVLHLGIVNNLLFLYAQQADMTGMTVTLEELRSRLFRVEVTSRQTREDLELFQGNALMFPMGWEGLCVSPAS